MTTIHVITGYREATADEITDGLVGSADEPMEFADEFPGEHVTFDFEPFGGLVVYRKPGQVWAAYAPGEWKKVRDVSTPPIQH